LKQTASGTGTAISTSNFTQDKFTPSFALMYKPVPFVSTYFSYMQGLIAGGTAPSKALNVNQILPPSVSEQYEVGAKASLGGMDLTVALFRIDKINEYTDPGDSIYKQDGREVHQGVEVTASGKIINRLTLVGGFTLMDAKVERARNNQALEGKTPVNVPEAQAKIYMEYELPFIPHLTATAGGNYFGRRPVDALNTTYFPEAITCDAGLRYQPSIYGHKTTLNLNVTNLFDKRYWSYYRSGDGLLLGEPRLFAFSAKVEW
jgi:iron complex outermembrane recepter protein